MKKTFFTIVMPIYNASKYIVEAIDDILSQTFEFWEMVCVDDGSKDESAEIVKSYMEKDDRIRLIQQENAGAGAARNHGLEKSNGSYVLFLDADDRFEKNLLEELYKKCDKTEADVIIYDVDSFDDRTKKVKLLPKHLNMKCIECDEDGVISLACKEENVYQISYSAVWNKAIKKDFLIENAITFQEIYVVDTLYFMLCVMAMAKKIAVLPKILMHYRTGVSSSQISNSDRSATGSLEAGIKAREYLIEHGCYDKYKKQFTNYILNNIKGRFGSFNSLEAESELHTALHEGGLESLGVMNMSIDDIETEELSNFIDEIKADYNAKLYNNACEWRKKKLISNKRFLISDFMQQRIYKHIEEHGVCRVALYGAGEVGKNYFAQLLNYMQLKVAGWYDKQYIQCGYPILNPEQLRTESDCIVIIAIESETVAEQIRTDILGYGIPSENIWWDRPLVK